MRQILRISSICSSRGCRLEISTWVVDCKAGMRDLVEWLLGSRLNKLFMVRKVNLKVDGLDKRTRYI